MPSVVVDAMRAASVAQSADKIKGARIGAVVRYGKSVYCGTNSRVSHPKQAEYARNPHSIYLHAEISALCQSEWRADRLVVVRILSNGDWAMAKPCLGCERAIRALGCKCWYSDLDGFLRRLM